MENDEMTRLEIQLTKTQKEYFEYAASLSDFENLNDFILGAIQAKAEEVLRRQSKITLSKRDQEIFFDSIFNDIEPNEELRLALGTYNKLCFFGNGSSK